MFFTPNTQVFFRILSYENNYRMLFLENDRGDEYKTLTNICDIVFLQKQLTATNMSPPNTHTYRVRNVSSRSIFRKKAFFIDVCLGHEYASNRTVRSCF